MNNRLLENDSGSFSSRSQRRLSCYYYYSLLTCILHIRCIGSCNPLSAATKLQRPALCAFVLIQYYLDPRPTIFSTLAASLHATMKIIKAGSANTIFQCWLSWPTLRWTWAQLFSQIEKFTWEIVKNWHFRPKDSASKRCWQAIADSHTLASLKQAFPACHSDYAVELRRGLRQRH